MNALATLEFRHHGSLAVELIEVGARVANILTGADERQRDPVNLLFHAELQRDLVALGDHGHVDGDVGQVDALE